MNYEKPDNLLKGNHKESNSKKPAEVNQNGISYSSKIREFIKSVLQEHNEEFKISEVAEMTGISRTYLYRIIPSQETPPKSAKNNPTRNMLLAIALALKFSFDETQNLLTCAGKPALQHNNNFDAAIIFALKKKYSVIMTNILLDEENCELLIFDK